MTVSETDPRITRIRIAAEKAKEKRPLIKPEIFDEIVALYTGAQSRLDGESAYLLQKTPAGFSPEDTELRREAGRLRAEEYAAIETTIIKRHGKDGESALRAIGNETRPASVFAPVLEQFYDSDKEQLRYGGIVGALIGGIGGYLLFGAKGVSVKGGLGIAAMTVVGSWLANQITQSVKDYMEDYRIRAKVKEIEKTPGKERAPDAPAAAPSPPARAVEQQPPSAEVRPEANPGAPGGHAVKHPTHFPGENPEEKGWQPRHPTHLYTPPAAQPAAPGPQEKARNAASGIAPLDGVTGSPLPEGHDHWNEGKQLPNASNSNKLPEKGAPQLP